MFLALASLSVCAHANSNNGVNEVLSVGIHDSGHALIVLASSSNTEGCHSPSSKNYVLLQKTNPNFKAMYATALLALSTGRPVEGWVDGCTDVWANGGTMIVTGTTLFVSK